ncbi:MAG: hypothetical protein ACTSPB_04785 [Candidatus Thorarchaeota archaeon]
MPTRIELDGRSPYEIKANIAIGDRLVFRSGVWGVHPRIITRKITGFLKMNLPLTSDGKPEVTHNGKGYVVHWHEIKAIIKKEQGK